MNTSRNNNIREPSCVCMYVSVCVCHLPENKFYMNEILLKSVVTAY